MYRGLRDDVGVYAGIEEWKNVHDHLPNKDFPQDSTILNYVEQLLLGRLGVLKTGREVEIFRVPSSFCYLGGCRG